MLEISNQMTRVSFACALLVFTVNGANADIVYRAKDQAGTMIFSDQPITGTTEIEKLDITPEDPAVAQQKFQQLNRQQRLLQSSQHKHGNLLSRHQSDR